MIHLILVVCALSGPPDCVEQRLSFFSDESLMLCMMRAQPFIAQWVEAHPQRRVARWRCAYPNSGDDPT